MYVCNMYDVDLIYMENIYGDKPTKIMTKEITLKNWNQIEIFSNRNI